MISNATLQRFLAVLAVMVLACYGEWLVVVHAQDWLPGRTGALVIAVGAFAVLGFFSWLTSWERRRRREDEAAVRRVIEAARSVGVEVPEDRAIFPLFYRGRRPTRTIG